MVDLFLVQVYLQCKQKREQELVCFIQPTTCVEEHSICEVLYDEINPLMCDWRLGRTARKQLHQITVVRRSEVVYIQTGIVLLSGISESTTDYTFTTFVGLNHCPLDWQSGALPRDHRSPLMV